MKSRKNHPIGIAFSLLLMIVATACGSLISEPPTPVPADTASPVPTSTPDPFTVIFNDDFSDPDSGWSVHPIDSTHEYSLEYVNGEYVLKRPQPGLVWVSPGGPSGLPKNLYQASVEFTVKSSLRSSDPYFGAYCGFKDDDNYYSLVVRSSGLYKIVKRVAGELTILSPDDDNGWAKSEKIAQWAPTYKFRVECGWEGLVLYVDGIIIDQIENAPSLGGEVRLRIGFYSNDGEIHIDDFRVGTIIG